MKNPAAWRLLLRVDDLCACRWRKPEGLRAGGGRMIAGEIERRPVSFAVAVVDAGDRVRRSVRSDADVADHRAAVARLQDRHDRAAALRLLHDEGAVARRRIADQEERQLALS